MSADEDTPATGPRGLEELNRAILESALDCIITMDAHGMVQEWNPAAERTFGYARAEAIGRELAELIVPLELRDSHRRGLAHYLKTGEGPVLGRRIEIAALRADGCEILVELAITAFHLDHAPVFAAYLRDITERVRSERRRDAQYAVASLLAGSWTIEEAAPQILQTIASSGNWVLSALWLCDAASGELRCKTVWRTNAPGLDKFEEVSRAKVFSGSGSLPGRVALSQKPTWISDVRSDSAFPRAPIAAAAGIVGGFAFPICAGGVVKGVIELFSPELVQPDEDLLLMVESLGSQIGHLILRHQIEAELQRQKEAAESANAAKDKFLATLSHELRTPLTPVLMWAGGMANDPATPQELREGLQMICRNVELESRLIDDLLDLTRITRGKLRLHLQEADAHQLLQHAIEIVQEGAGKSGPHLDVRLTATDHRVRVDPARLQQVFWNLLRNAYQFTGPEGSITVRSENLKPSFITFSVADTGVGIAPESRGRIFDAFEQAAGRREGLGLGLAISKAILESHSGSITVESEGIGKGATFVIELPTIPAGSES